MGEVQGLTPVGEMAGSDPGREMAGSDPGNGKVQGLTPVRMRRGGQGTCEDEDGGDEVRLGECGKGESGWGQTFERVGHSWLRCGILSTLNCGGPLRLMVVDQCLWKVLDRAENLSVLEKIADALASPRRWHRPGAGGELRFRSGCAA